MSINLVVLDGVVKSLALRYDSQAKAEPRFTLAQTDHAIDGTPWVSYWPCCASGSAAERLASEIEDGQHLLITSGKLCYRKREGKMGLQSRMEILVWTVDRLTTLPKDEELPGIDQRSALPEYGSDSDHGALLVEPASVPQSKTPRKHSHTRASLLAWEAKG